MGSFWAFLCTCFWPTWLKKGVHFGTLFFSKSASWVHFGGSASQKTGPGGGSEMDPKKESQMVPNLAPIWGLILFFFRDLFADMSF